MTITIGDIQNITTTNIMDEQTDYIDDWVSDIPNSTEPTAVED